MVFPSLIPPGFTAVETEQLESLFVAPFADQNTRRRLVGGFLDFVDVLRKIQLRCEIWIDGSFTTSKVRPSDIDILILCGEADLRQLGEEGFNMLEAVTRRRDETKARFFCDVYVCDAANERRVSYWRNWFGYSKDGTPKGIARLRIEQ